MKFKLVCKDCKTNPFNFHKNNNDFVKDLFKEWHKTISKGCAFNEYYNYKEYENKLHELLCTDCFINNRTAKYVRDEL